MQACYFMNNSFFLHFNEHELWTRICWFTKKFTIPKFDIYHFFRDLQIQRKYFFEHQNTLCEKCFVPRNEEFNLELKERSLLLNLKVSSLCNIKCPYCWSRGNRNILFTTPYLQHKKIVDTIISNPLIKSIKNWSGGEFFSNKELMQMYINWKEKYGVQLDVCTNFTLYDPTYPLDKLTITWHKSANQKIIRENLKKIPDRLFPVQMRFMIGDLRYTWDQNEAFQIVKNCLSPNKFTVLYSDLYSDTDPWFKEYSQLQKDQLVEKTKNLGYTEVTYEHFKNK